MNIQSRSAEILAWARQYAREHRWILNPDIRQLEIVIRDLVRNEARFGARYCLCRIRRNDPAKDLNIVCPCIFHEEEIAEEGHCYCNLFYAGVAGAAT
jgi:ferredoxin-thioredoxin reductase catalytic chain